MGTPSTESNKRARGRRGRGRLLGPTGGACVVLGSLATIGTAAWAGPAAGVARDGASKEAPACLWTKAPKVSAPVLTNPQVSSVLRQTVTFGGTSGPVAEFTCQWNGKPLPPARPANPESRHFQPQLWLELHDGATPAGARSFYNEVRTGFGGLPGAAPDIGQAAAFLPGQDIVTVQLVVLSGHDAFLLSLGSTVPRATQKAQLAALARQVVAGL